MTVYLAFQLPQRFNLGISTKFEQTLARHFFMSNLLKNKAIVIIGGTTGIGLAAAQSFQTAGAQLVVLGKEESSSLVAQKILGEQVPIITGDAMEEGIAERAIQVCEEIYGSLHGLYHVAGGSGRRKGDGPLHELSLDGWNYTLQLNLTSMMLSNRAAIRVFLKQQSGGSLLNMGSVLGFSPSPQYFSTHAYAAAKSAVIGFTKSIAAYYAPHNIRANVLAPALVETPMSRRAARDEPIMAFVQSKQPLDGGRIGQPEDLTGIACYCMSDQSRFTTGQVFVVDGGWSVSEGQMSRQ